MNSFTTRFGVAVLTFSLSGCASIPLGAKVAALVGSGVSYVTTGKTLPDHALSSVTRQDCRMTRLVTGDWMCTTLPSIEPDPPVVADVEIPAPSQQGGRYAVIGSFSSAGNARKWSTRFPELAPQVIAVQIEEQTLYRVAVGPLANGASTILTDQFSLAGIENTWTMTVCPNGSTTSTDNCRLSVASL